TTGEAESDELSSYLKQHLPQYMIPVHYVHIDSMPLGSNGKVNKKALPIPEINTTNESSYIAPFTKLEKALVKIWSKILSIPEETISIKADFFYLGGHSIKAVRLLGMIHKELKVELPLKDLFLANTIESQAKLIAKKELKTYQVIDVIPQQPDYKLSPAQRRLWILNHFEGAQN